MLVPHEDISETNIVGKSTRLHAVTADQCLPLKMREIAEIGAGDAEAPYRVVRMSSAGAYLHGSINGSGRVFLDGRWQSHRQKMTSFVPPHVLQGFHAIDGITWRVCWVRFTPQSSRSTLGSMAPVLSAFDPSPLGNAILGLYEEVTNGTNDFASCTLWVELIEKYISHFAEPWRRDERLVRVWDAVQADLGRNWTMRDFSGLAHVSEEHFRRLCNSSLGRSPFKQLIALRVQQAAHLFATTNDTVEAVAASLGYENPFVFSNMFLRTVGVRPSQFRRTRRASEGSSGSQQLSVA